MEAPKVPFSVMSLPTQILIEVEIVDATETKPTMVRIQESMHGYNAQINYNYKYDSAEGVAVHYIRQKLEILPVARVGTKQGVGLLYDYMDGDESVAVKFWNWLRPPSVVEGKIRQTLDIPLR